MAVNDLFNLHYNNFKRLYPEGTEEQFINYVKKRVSEDKLRAIKNYMRQTQNTVNEEVSRMNELQGGANRNYNLNKAIELAEQGAREGGSFLNNPVFRTITNGLKTAGKYSPILGFADMVLDNAINERQKEESKKRLQEQKELDERIKNKPAVISSYSEPVPKVAPTQQKVASGLFNPLGPIGNVVDTGINIAQNLLQGGKSNEFNDRLGRYSNPDTVHYNQLNVSPEKRQKFEQMMQEKAAGGTGEIARQKDKVNTTEPANQEVPEEEVTPSAANGGLPPTSGLIIDDTADNNNQNLSLVPVTNINGIDSMDNSDNDDNIQLRAQDPVSGQNNGVMGAAANIGDVDMINQLMNPVGQITPEQMRGYIDQAYNAQVQAANRNPLYGGEYVQPGGYQIDKNELARRQTEDELIRRSHLFGNQTPYEYNSANQYIANQRQMYNAEMANRAGVPYEDYVAGMAKRNADEIAIRQKQAEAQLKAYAQQSTDMNTRLQIAQKIMHDRQEAQNKIDEIYANMQKDLAVENLKGKWDYAKQGLSNTGTMQNTALQGANAMNLEQYKQTNPQAVFRNLAYFLYNAGIPLMGDKKAMARLIASQPQDTQIQMFGRVVSPDEAEILLNSMQTQEQNNPGWFQRFLNPGNYDTNFGQY